MQAIPKGYPQPKLFLRVMLATAWLAGPVLAAPVTAEWDGKEAVLADLYVPSPKQVQLPGPGLEEIGTDRYGRTIISHPYAINMLRQGEAFYYPESVVDAAPLRAAEAQARKAQRGLWSGGGPVMEAATLPADASGFAIVRGKVLAVSVKRGNVYVNFGEDWKTDFTLFIDRAHQKDFAGVDLQGLVGKRLEVRGLLSNYYGPMIELTHPNQLEIFP